jgi:acrylyl-CoA reductase (NADPH)
MAPHVLREQAWQRLARDLDSAPLERISNVIGLASVITAAQDLMAGKIRGRIVVDVNN